MTDVPNYETSIVYGPPAEMWERYWAGWPPCKCPLGSGNRDPFTSPIRVSFDGHTLSLNYILLLHEYSHRIVA